MEDRCQESLSRRNHTIDGIGKTDRGKLPHEIDELILQITNDKTRYRARGQIGSHNVSRIKIWVIQMKLIIRLMTCDSINQKKD